MNDKPKKVKGKKKSLVPAVRSEERLVPLDPFAAYLQEAKRYPILSEEEEKELAIRLTETGDVDAAYQLTTANLMLVVKIAMTFKREWQNVMDLVQEGNIGLMKAVKRFDPEKGFRLATYAMWWIRASIQEYILRSWSLVKMGTTSAQKKLFFNLRKAKSRIGALDEGDMHPKKVARIAQDLGVTEDEVVMMNRRLSGGDASLNAIVGSADGDSSMEWQDWLEDEDADQASDYEARDELESRRALLSEAMSALNEREQDVLAKRRLSDTVVTLEQLSEQYNVSRERIRQIEVRAFEKLQLRMRELAQEKGLLATV